MKPELIETRLNDIDARLEELESDHAYVKRMHRFFEALSSAIKEGIGAPFVRLERRKGRPE